MDDNFQCLYIAFFMDRNNITLFQLRRENTCIDTHCLKIMANGLRLAGPQIFNIRMLISMRPRTLPESKFRNILAISFCEKVIEDKRLLVKYCICVGRVFPLFIRGHCSDKNELKSSAFSKKFVTNSFSWNNGGIRGTFLLFKKIFNRNQYGLKLLWRLFCLFAVRS